jgi:ornithine--oxo-acid transaminase
MLTRAANTIFTGHSTRRFATNASIQALEEKYVCKNYSSLPIAIERGERIYLWDVEGKRYFDFISGYGATSQGHVHPKILKAFVEQACKVTLTSRAMLNTQLGKFGELMSQVTGYDKMLPCNGGVEADETACKLARRWGYRVKKIPSNKANILFPTGNFWGRTITASGACDDPARYTDFGPFTAGFELFKYNNVEALRTKLKNDPNICAVCIESIQVRDKIFC